VNELIVFAKAPVPGQVKTRLAQKIGAEGACTAYRQMLKAIGAVFSKIERATVQHWPTKGDEALRRLLPSEWAYRPQEGEDLGERLLNAFSRAFSLGARKVAIIGSDCPYVTVDHLEQAWRELDSADIVFGPAVDGGYWLVAAKQVHPEPFRNISWGGAMVLEQSLEAARGAGLMVRLLEKLHDIDTIEDWEEYTQFTQPQVA